MFGVAVSALADTCPSTRRSPRLERARGKSTFGSSARQIAGLWFEQAAYALKSLTVTRMSRLPHGPRMIRIFILELGRIILQIRMVT